MQVKRQLSNFQPHWGSPLYQRWKLSPALDTFEVNFRAKTHSMTPGLDRPLNLSPTAWMEMSRLWKNINVEWADLEAFKGEKASDSKQLALKAFDVLHTFRRF